MRVAVVLAAMAALGCEGGPRDVDWVLHFEDDATKASVRAIEVCIVAEGCPTDPLRCDGAGTRYRDAHAFDGSALMIAEGASEPPQLPEGRYGFVARARDATCRVVASGCEPVALPRGRVTVTLTGSPVVNADCCGATCRDGACLGGDAGPACAEDDNPCTASACDASGACIQAPVIDGTACPDPGASECLDGVCVAGACTESAPVVDGTACTDPGADPCRTGACSGGACVESVFLDGASCESDGDPCSIETCNQSAGGCQNVHREDGLRCTDGGAYEQRCCNGRCTDISQPENCGGCFEACAPGRACRARAGEPWAYSCDCSSASDCPGTTRGWICPAVGRCECMGMGTCTSPRTICRSLAGSPAAFCGYPSGT